jgi:very-short-patch-repair endonuclease
MGKFDWNKVTREDVEKAIKKFLEDTPEYPMPRSTFLLYDNKKLPAKHIRGMAYKIANGKEISKDDYAGGMETVRFFNKLGFDVFYKDSVITGDTITEKKLGVVSDHNMQAMKLEPVVEERTVEQAVQVKTCIKKKESPNEQKIKIPSKEVIEQKNALQLLLNKYFDGDIVCEKTYSWLKTPDEIAGSYIKIYDALHGLHGDTKFAKKNVTLRCDFVCESRKTIIEYDERQHFSQARLVSLQAYPDDVQLYFDKEFWIKACEDIQAKDNSPVNRDETRAFYDSTRDIECARHGYKLIRIMHGQVDWNQPDALETLKALVGEKADTEEMDTADQKCVAENEPAKAGEIKGKGDYPDIQIKIGLYLQTQTACDKKSFDEAMQVAKMSDFDILVFPEDCYCPRIEEFWNLDITKEEDINTLFDYCVELSESIDKAVVFSAMDSYGTPYSIFANYKSQDDETNVQM